MSIDRQGSIKKKLQKKKTKMRNREIIFNIAILIPLNSDQVTVSTSFFWALFLLPLTHCCCCLFSNSLRPRPPPLSSSFHFFIPSRSVQFLINQKDAHRKTVNSMIPV